MCHSGVLSLSSIYEPFHFSRGNGVSIYFNLYVQFDSGVSIMLQLLQLYIQFEVLYNTISEQLNVAQILSVGKHFVSTDNTGFLCSTHRRSISNNNTTVKICHPSHSLVFFPRLETCKALYAFLN